MKILMQGRLELMSLGGGDKVQIENTADQLRKLGVSVDISTSVDTDYSKYDLIHLFQLDWTPESYIFAKKAKNFNKPLVLSPIHHSVNEVKKFDDTYVFGLRRVSKLLFKEQHSRDTFKNVYKTFFDISKIKPTLLSVFLGLKKMHQITLKLSNIVLVQTEAEANDLMNTYGVKIKYAKVPNGVGDQFINPEDLKNLFEFKDYIVCVGRIEPRKNQLSIIQAVETFREANKLDTKLVFIGKKSTKRHLEYILRFNKKMKECDWIRHIENVEYSKMPSVYHFAKVCVSASWFETTGLTSLEAIFCGANAVASGDRAREYLGESASYCSPESIDSIVKAITQEYYAKRPLVDDFMLKEYTWENAAKETKKIYESILGQ